MDCLWRRGLEDGGLGCVENVSMCGIGVVRVVGGRGERFMLVEGEGMG